MSGANIDIGYIVVSLAAFLVAITVHEYAHARAALAAGDDTAKLAGRVSLNPIKHLDPVGTVFLLLMIIRGFPIAWGKPVPINSYNFKNPRWDSLKVSLWGPLSNVITAFALGLMFRWLVVPIAPAYAEFFGKCILINLALAFFNLIPVPPLDGAHILSSLLPIEMAREYNSVLSRYGIMILIVVLITGIPSLIILPPVKILFTLFTGYRLV